MIKTFLQIFAIIFLIIIALFIFFVIDARKEIPLSKNLHCENIVVLTGGKNRISFAMNSANRFRAKNVFISGVYKSTTEKDLFSGENFENVNIVLGYNAKNTEENALEIRNFVRDENVNEIILVTSDYHMFRSMYEIKKYNPDLRIFPVKVKTSFGFKFIQLCCKEFYRCSEIFVRNFMKKKKND